MNETPAQPSDNLFPTPDRDADTPQTSAEAPAIQMTVPPSALEPIIWPDNTSATCPTGGVPRTAGPRLARRQVGEYDIQGELGRGGMGVVYRAVHRTLKRVVALKMILSGQHAGSEQLARFRVEAEAAARLQHPHIVQIYEVGEEEGLPFFSLEMVEGGSLDRHCAGRPQPPRSSAQLVATLAAAMHYAHQKGIVHRDLKPANILLALSDASPKRPGEGHFGEASLNECVPKITDFGLAKQLDAEQGQTRTGAVMGTPSYMAPEQAEGRIRDIDARTDVWALGAILYECLTGRPPFRGTSIRDTLEQVCTQEPVPPSRLQPRVARDLETVCLKCLRKEPERRYASAQHLAEDLQCYLDNRPILARPVSTGERALKWARRRPAQAALAVALVLLVVCGASGALFYGLYQDQQATGYKRQLGRLQRAEDLRARGQQAEDSGRLAEANTLYTRALGELGHEPDPAAAALRRQVVERHDRVQQRLDEAARTQRAQLEQQQHRDRVRQLLEKDRGDILPREMGVTEEQAGANRAYLRAEVPAALERFGLRVTTTAAAEAADLLKPYRKFASKTETQRVATAICELLLILAEAEATPPHRPAKGPKEALRLLAVAEALGHANNLPLPRAFHQRRARYLEAHGDSGGAAAARARANATPADTPLDYFLTALERYHQGQFAAAARACDKTLHKEPEHFWAQFLQAVCYLRIDRWEQAKDGLTACLRRRQDLLWTYLLRATAYGGLGDFAAAEADFVQALERAGTDDFARWVLFVNRGVTRIRHQRLARVAARANVPVLAATASAAGPLLVVTGLLAMPSARGWENAVADLNEAVRLRPQAYEVYAQLALAHQGRGNLDAAAAALTEVLRHRDDPKLYFQRARINVERKQFAAARRDFKTVAERDGLPARRASACVELGNLLHQDRQFEAALVCCADALRLRPGFALAYRQQAQTLLALARADEENLLQRGGTAADVRVIRARYVEAGRALGRFLEKERRTPASELAAVYHARARIHVRLKDFPAARDACNESLRWQRDLSVRNLRGWVYLKMDAAQPAQDDFEAVLREDGRHSDALCGRGLAQVLLGEVPSALADAQASLQHGGRTRRLLINAACIHARAAVHRQTAPRAPANSAASRSGRLLPVGSLARQIALRAAQDTSREAEELQEQAVQLLRAAVESVPEAARPAFWRESIQGEPALHSLRRSPAMLLLARQFAS